jgi:hypothetical protein
LDKTVKVREAAKAGLEADVIHPDCSLFKAAMDAVATFNELKGENGETLPDLLNLVFCVTTWVEEIPLPEEISAAYIGNALRAQSMWTIVKEDNCLQLVNSPPRGFEPAPPIVASNEQVLELLKGCGVVTASAAQISHAHMKLPPGCPVTARDAEPTTTIVASTAMRSP